MTQLDQVRKMLEQAAPGGVCAKDFLDERIHKYPAWVFELRQAGTDIESRSCDNKQHRHRYPQIEYRLVPPETGDQSRFPFSKIVGI